MKVGLPAVTVLMATYNGMPYLPEQVQSILDQEGVDVRLVVSDDESEDGTWEWLTQKAAAGSRLVLLPRIEPSGGFAANFYRLLRDAPLAELVAFSDQDDIWRPGKLAHQVATLQVEDLDGVSSNVTAVTAAGDRLLIRKNYPQRRLDYLFEAPGPGSTFLFTRRLAATIREQLTDTDGPGRTVQAHDWLTYAICRARGWRWHIEETPWVDYRQHDANVLGANRGVRQAVRRFQDLRSGWYRREIVKVTETVAPLAIPTEYALITRVHELLLSRSVASRAQLLTLLTEIRRRPRDRWILGALLAAGLC